METLRRPGKACRSPSGSPPHRCCHGSVRGASQAQLDRRSAAKSQQTALLRLVRYARRTRFGVDHDFKGIRTVEDYQRRVPLRSYESFWTEYWRILFPLSRQCLMAGHDSVLRAVLRHDQRRDQIHPLDAADARVQPEGRADDVCRCSWRRTPARRCSRGDFFSSAAARIYARSRRAVRRYTAARFWPETSAASRCARLLLCYGRSRFRLKNSPLSATGTRRCGFSSRRRWICPSPC